MASSGKKKTTFAKLARESRLRERRLDKQARKDARKRAAEMGSATPGDESFVEGATPGDETLIEPAHTGNAPPGNDRSPLGDDHARLSDQQ